jgi:hypothetical protein
MPDFPDEESYMNALDSGLLAEAHVKYKGPIIDLTHLAEEPALDNDTNEIDNDSDLLAANLLRA